MTPAVVLVDSNVLLDIATADPAWFEWSAGALARLAERRRLAVNPIVRGGVRRSPLPGFYIGAHAAVSGLALLTREPGRYRTYFPTVELIAPEGA